jgi:hypothetical protein
VRRQLASKCLGHRDVPIFIGLGLRYVYLAAVKVYVLPFESKDLAATHTCVKSHHHDQSQVGSPTFERVHQRISPRSSISRLTIGSAQSFSRAPITESPAAKCKTRDQSSGESGFRQSPT